jgi:transaldolase
MNDTRNPAAAMPEQDKPLWQLTRLGQSIWLDYIRRGILENGELERMIREHAVRGVTSNPAIFEQAIAGSADYDEALQRLARSAKDAKEVYESFAIEDIQRAADLFRAIYDESQGIDGYVSLEVSPELAHDTDATLDEARRLWQAVARPNVMIKVPGTEAGIPAVEQLLFEGINVNVTLLFALAEYERVMEAYLRGLERRVAEGKPVAGIASVASFFVSRVDTAVDEELETRIAAESDETRRAQLRALLGKTAIANAKLAYARFREVFGADRFAALEAQGAQLQRPLWASTSTKNPAYRDVIYIEELIGPDTVNTVPLKTLEAFADHGVARRTVDADLDAAHQHLQELREAGIELDEVTARVQREGIAKFVDPFRSMLDSVQTKLSQVAR